MQNFSVLPTRTWHGAKSIFRDGLKGQHLRIWYYGMVSLGLKEVETRLHLLLPWFNIAKKVDRWEGARAFLALKECLTILLFLPKDQASLMSRGLWTSQHRMPPVRQMWWGQRGVVFRRSLPTYSFLSGNLTAHYSSHLTPPPPFRVEGFLGAQHSSSFFSQNQAPELSFPFSVLDPSLWPSQSFPLTVMKALMSTWVNTCWYLLTIATAYCSRPMGTIQVKDCIVSTFMPTSLCPISTSSPIHQVQNLML